MSDSPIQFLEVRPATGQLDKDGAVADILSFGNQCAIRHPESALMASAM